MLVERACSGRGKNKLWVFLVCIVTVVAPATAGTALTLIRGTIDGGGVDASGGSFRLRGTIGQPDAGRHSGGVFVLQSGFWSGELSSHNELIFKNGFE